MSFDEGHFQLLAALHQVHRDYELSDTRKIILRMSSRFQKLLRRVVLRSFSSSAGEFWARKV
jgi:hypothetical protein